MTTLDLDADNATISLSLTELYIVNNAVNEVCNALDIDEFSTRMGVEREDASKFLEQIHALITHLEQA
jgi:hypothetical protein